MAWITEKHVATCSKDSSIALWSVDDCGGHHTVTAPLLSRLDHRAKVRDMKFCFRSQMLSTVGADATVRLWDAKLQAIRTVSRPGNLPPARSCCAARLFRRS